MSSLVTKIIDANYAGNFEEAACLAQAALEESSPLLSTHRAIALNQLGRWNETLVVVQKTLDAGLMDIEWVANLNAEKVFALIAIGSHSLDAQVQAAQVARKILALPFINAWLRGDISASLAMVLNCMGDHGEARSVAAKARDLPFSDETLRARLQLEESTAFNRLEKFKNVPSAPIVDSYLSALISMEELYALNAQGKHSDVLLLIAKLADLTTFQQQPNLRVRLLVEKAKALEPREAIIVLQEAFKTPNINDEVSALIAIEMAKTYHALGQPKKACEITKSAIDSKTLKDERLKALLCLQRAQALNHFNDPEASKLCFKALGFKSVKETRLIAELTIELAKALIGLCDYEGAFAATSKACERLSLQNGEIKATLMVEQATSLISLRKFSEAAEIVTKALAFPQLKNEKLIEALKTNLDCALKNEEEQNFERLQEEQVAKCVYEKLKKIDIPLTRTQGLVCHLTNTPVKQPVEYRGKVYNYKNFISCFKNREFDDINQIYDLNFLRRVVIKRVPISNDQ